MTALDVVSCGAGVQSTAIALLSADGRLPVPDHVIFADTGWEPPQVYRQVDRLEELYAGLGAEFHRVAQGNLRADAIDPAHRFASVPYFVRNPDGSEGMGRRQCTSEYKLAPIRRKIRELLGAAAPDFRRVPRDGRAAREWVGFSTDEIGRVSDGRTPQYLTTWHPLLELGLSRRDCSRLLERAGWGDTAKSACIGCPYHGNRQWRQMRARRNQCARCGHDQSDHWRGFPGTAAATDPAVILDADHLSCAHVVATLGDPADRDAPVETCRCPRFVSEWADAVEFDRAIRKGGARGLPLNGEAFLHRSRVPLDQAPIDHVTHAEVRDRTAEQQGDLFELLEDGDPDGCSPYGCRSGEPVTAPVDLDMPTVAGAR